MSIPAMARSFLASGDSLARAQIAADHPEVQAQLDDPATRQAILEWLTSDEARRPEMASLVLGVLGFLRPDAVPGEAAVVRPFTLHPEPTVRQRAFEFLLTLYFPDRNREALLLVLQSMLSDADDAVRAQGARYVERAEAQPELAAFLAGWRGQAPDRDWHTGAAAELVDRLLAEDEEG